MPRGKQFASGLSTLFVSLRCFLIAAAQGVSGRPPLMLVPISQNAATGGELGSGGLRRPHRDRRRGAATTSSCCLAGPSKSRQAPPVSDPNRFSARRRRGRACHRPFEASARRAVGVPARLAGRPRLHAWATAPRRTLNTPRQGRSLSELSACVPHGRGFLLIICS